jgi:drug/metabolite transporter superfamily protein YnfA
MIRLHIGDFIDWQIHWRTFSQSNPSWWRGLLALVVWSVLATVLLAVQTGRLIAAHRKLKVLERYR